MFFHANFQANCDLQRARMLVIESDILPHEHNIYAAREPDDVAEEDVDVVRPRHPRDLQRRVEVIVLAVPARGCRLDSVPWHRPKQISSMIEVRLQTTV